MDKTYREKYLEPHQLYHTYSPEWLQNQRSYLGGITYRNAGYLRAYSIDAQTPSETITTYDQVEGQVVGKHQTKLVHGSMGTNLTDNTQGGGSFYTEKLRNVPLYNYVKLIVSEYNSILFRNPAQRLLPDTAIVTDFVNDCDGHGNSITEFMSQVDIASTVNGVCYVGVYQNASARLPRLRLHQPTDVLDWEYVYDSQGNIKINMILLRKIFTSQYEQFLRITPEEYTTIWVRSDDSDDWQPGIPDAIEVEDGVWEYSEANLTGKIPVVPVYQSSAILNGVGTTPISDISQIQRSIYGDSAEIYSAITYGAHPSLVVDNTTHQLNAGEVGAEPGSVILVDSSISGESNHVFEFVAPDLQAITEIRDLIDNKIEKITQTAMIRSDHLIKTANSGHQLEVLDDKLNALIRKKATNMENAETKIWACVAEYMGLENAEFMVSYPRNYAKKGLTEEITEVNALVTMLQNVQAISGNVAISADIMESLQARVINLIESTSSSNSL